MKNFVWSLLLVFSTCASARAQSGDCGNNKDAEAFPSARFYEEFRKHDSLPLFSWQGRMGMDVVAYRRGCHSLFMRIDFQTVGAETINYRVNIAGTSYIVESGYKHTLRSGTQLEFGMTHLSSHLAADLLRFFQEERRIGTSFPAVEATDLNVGFVGLEHRFGLLPFEPRVQLRIQPLGFRFRDEGYRFKQPVYLATKFNLWRGNQRRFTFDTSHEWGKSSLNTLSFRLHLFEHNQGEGRLQPFVTWVGGSKIFVGPNEGWNHSGWSFGTRLVFQTN